MHGSGAAFCRMPFFYRCSLRLAGLAIIPITRFFYFLRVLWRACLLASLIHLTFGSKCIIVWGGGVLFACALSVWLCAWLVALMCLGDVFANVAVRSLPPMQAPVPSSYPSFANNGLGGSQNDTSTASVTSPSQNGTGTPSSLSNLHHFTSPLSNGQNNPFTQPFPAPH